MILRGLVLKGAGASENRKPTGAVMILGGRNIVIEDCVFKFSNRGAICVGSECSGGARNIFARNSQINPANAADQLWYALFVKT